LNTISGGTGLSNKENGRFYPLTAIVGQESKRIALVLNAVNPEIGGVIIRGPSGTAKSTAVRGLAELLPEVEVISDCPFQCDPHDSHGQCDACKERIADGEELPVISRRRRLINLPLNATEDRVVGSLDITKALREGIKALEPGLLADANRGILYIDEINLLDDHIVDILLDAAAMRVNIVEREGVSVSHPSQFLMIGTMNPEEGELRPQIADRIGLQVEINALPDMAQRVEVMKRREAFQIDPDAFVAQFSERQESLRDDIQRALGLLPQVTVSERYYEIIAQITLKTEALSHRADITILQCAKAVAALDGRTELEARDILMAGTLALGHRMPHDPFTADPVHDAGTLVTKIEDILDEEDEDPEKKKSRAHQPMT